MQSTWQDIRFAARLLLKDRWFTLAAVVALALGIGANNAVFTLVNAVILRGLPFERAERIVWIGTRDARGRDGGASLKDMQDWEASTRSVSALASILSTPFAVGDDDRAAESYPGAYAAAALFPITGEKAVVGRTFTPDHDRDGAAPTAVLGGTVWKGRYAGDPSIVGRTIRVGLGVSFLGIRWFDAAIADAGKPYWMTFTFDVPVFAFFAAVCVATGIVFGLVPALNVSQVNVLDVLSQGRRSGSAGARTQRWTGALIVAQLSLTLVLLSGAGLMMRSFLSLSRMDLGIETSRLLTAQLTMVTRKFPTSETRAVFLRRLNEHLATGGDIVAAATTSNLPMAYGAERQLALDGHPLAPGERPPLVTLLDVGQGYFDTLGVRLARGRAFDEVDGTPGHESAIVNQRFVAMHFPREDPIGQRIRLNTQGSSGPDIEWLTIVGIAPTVRQRNVQEPDPDPVVYVPHRTNTNLSPTTNILLRGRGNPAALAPILRRAIAALDPDLPLANVRTMDDFLAQLRWPSRVFGTMFAIFAVIALVLATVGLYAVTAYSVTQRTQELGIRMALGAQPAHLRWVILRRGIAQIAIGLTFGLAGAFGVGRLLQSSMLLFHTGAADPITLVVIVGVLVTVAVAACLWPVRRAIRLDPSASLRSD